MPVLFGVTYKSQKIKNYIYTDLVENYFLVVAILAKKKKKNLQYPLCLPCELTSQERTQIFHIDDVSLPGSG